MKKNFLIITFIVFMIMLQVGQFAKDNNFFAEIDGGLYMSSDSGYKDIYGSSMFCPELRVGFSISDSIYLFSGFSMFKKTGKTLIFNEEAKSSRTVISFGVGYLKEISGKLGLRAELGGIQNAYKEEALGEEITGKKFGFSIGAGIYYNLSDKLYITSNIKYSIASDTIEETKIKLGGLNILLGLGVRL